MHTTPLITKPRAEDGSVITRGVFAYRIFHPVPQGSAGPGPFGLRSGGGDRVLAGGAPHAHGACRTHGHAARPLGSASESILDKTPNARSPVVGGGSTRRARGGEGFIFCVAL